MANNSALVNLNYDSKLATMRANCHTHSAKGISPISLQPARKITVCDRLLFVWAQNAPRQSRWSKLVIVVARAGRTQRTGWDWLAVSSLEWGPPEAFCAIQLQMFAEQIVLHHRRTDVPTLAKKAARIQRTLHIRRPGALRSESVFGFSRPSMQSSSAWWRVFFLGGCTHIKSRSALSVFSRGRRRNWKFNLQYVHDQKPITPVCEHRRLQRNIYMQLSTALNALRGCESLELCEINFA